MLVLLAGAILLYRSFRENYLLAWIFGWISFTLGRLLVAVGAYPHYDPLLFGVGYALFITGMGLFAASVFLYVDHRRFIWPVAAALAGSLVLGYFAYFGHAYNTGFTRAFQISWRAVLAVAALQLLRSAWGRFAFGRWLLAVMLFLPHLHQSRPAPSDIWHDVIADLLLGISMVLIVLDDSAVQIKRLNVLNTIADQIAASREFDPSIVLSQLMQITRARAAWYRVLQGDKLVLSAHRGLSSPFIEGAQTIDINRSVSGFALRESEVYVMRSTEATPEMVNLLKADRIHHMLIVPVEGKSSQIGILALGVGQFRTHAENEKDFLKAAARQLGLAAENRQLVQQVVRSQSEWATTFDSIADGILVHDDDYKILRANDALLRRLNRERDDVVGQFCHAVLPGAGINWNGCPYCAHQDCSGEMDPAFGGYSVVSTSALAGEHGSHGKVHVIKDITEARAAEERYSSLFNHMHEGVFTSTPDGKLLDCNEAFVRMLGYFSKEELLRLENVESLYVDHEDRSKYRDEIERHGYIRNFEFKLRRRDGSEIFVIESSFATRGPSGRVERYQGVLMDVTDTKRAEDEIRRRNRELYVLNNIAVTFNQSFDLDEILQLIMLQIIELLNADTASVYLFEEETNTLLKRAGYGHRSAIVGDNDRFPLPENFVESLRRHRVEIIDHEAGMPLPPLVQKIVEEEGLKAWMWVILWRKEKMLGVLATSSRQPRHFNESEESVVIAVGRQLATTIEKIRLYHETKKAYEDLRRTQEQLLQSEKMSAVGQLISGVAHELNNPLTAILGYAQLLESETMEPRVSEYVLKLHKQAQRTQKIVQNLLSFARQQKPRRVHVDLRNVIEDTMALRDYDMKVNNIVVQRDFQGPLPAVIADPHQLEQVYLNIINNAADAMLETSRGGVLNIRLFRENGHVVSEFHDSGPGISDPKHVFDPFFTTKGVGKGTGLGLSICYGIVKEHGGEISAGNHPQGGALLRVRIPVAEGEAPLTERDRIVARREPQLEGRVLLIDDEEAVLDYEREVLAAAGLRVTTATSGRYAIELLEQEQFDGILLDNKIPGEVSSEDVYRYLEKNLPELLRKTVLVLSNISDPEARAFVDATQVLCLVKPFEVADLLAAARRMLRRARVAAHS
ncbi:MAG TPA: ATP-binding protein [Candidatus Limnocylindrales bacterium]|nr:ATP-binding protein [Candidatus Limnocylindrales bacterium]